MVAVMADAFMVVGWSWQRGNCSHQRTVRVAGKDYDRAFAIIATTWWMKSTIYIWLHDGDKVVRVYSRAKEFGLQEPQFNYAV